RSYSARILMELRRYIPTITMTKAAKPKLIPKTSTRTSTIGAQSSYRGLYSTQKRPGAQIASETVAWLDAGIGGSESARRVKPRSGERIQPTAQAVGRKRRENLSAEGAKENPPAKLNSGPDRSLGPNRSTTPAPSTSTPAPAAETTQSLPTRSSSTTTSSRPT